MEAVSVRKVISAMRLAEERDDVVSCSLVPAGVRVEVLDNYDRRSVEFFAPAAFIAWIGEEGNDSDVQIVR